MWCRSKELELGGGAAALQGVGIQAVVTECLICYCDLIFNDKMPSYSSPHLQSECLCLVIFDMKMPSYPLLPYAASVVVMLSLVVI